MTKQVIVNVAASVRQRLLNLARERKEDFNLVLTKYGLERVLYRIAQSQYKDLFVLKGALLFEVWTEQRYRPTRDADFLARGQNDPERFIDIFKDICGMVVDDDGLQFDASSVTGERITEDADYEGIRVKFIAHLENARISIQIDLGFGDVVTPAPVEVQLPTLLDLPAPRLLSYPKESVIAEKLEALVSLGITNSRMKDLHDIRSLAREFVFDGDSLSEAIQKTFVARQTALPKDKPPFLTSEFFDSEEKKKQWDAFCSKNKAYVIESELETVCEEIDAFLSPILRALAGNSTMSLTWTREGGWR